MRTQIKEPMETNPGRPSIGWRTDAGNRAGTAHRYYDATEGDKTERIARSVCGREVFMTDLQAERDSLKRCKRCEAATQPTAQSDTTKTPE